ncbi:MAG: hypothetical protein N2167_09720 [Flavobacteriales bacterium]|nr:hypothetical protein [Flavobacteriales bacterium]
MIIIAYACGKYFTHSQTPYREIHEENYFTYYCYEIKYSVFEWEKREWVKKDYKWVLSEYHYNTLTDTIIHKFPLDQKEIIYTMQYLMLRDEKGDYWKLSFDNDGIYLNRWDVFYNQHQIYLVYKKVIRA